ncbi:MFS transporter [Microtetraspora fusca]|uniref:MFS transporter n=1 Tax=Microtetraspora fusca TaxID=1997 RepID=A0ABW6VAY5_MICFU
MPFLMSIVLLGVGLFVRLRVEETPVFTAARDAAARRGAPLMDVLRNHPRTLLLGVGVGLSAFVLQGTLTTYLIAYGVQAGFPRQTVLNGLTLSSGVAIVGIIGWSALSDRLGRRPVVLAGAAVSAVFGFVLFPMVDSGSAVMLAVALVLGQGIVQPMMYGPLAALYAELFGTESRYTGASLGYQIAGLGAGLTPLLFAQIQASAGGGGTIAISVIIAVSCLLTVACMLALRETSRADLASGTLSGSAEGLTPGAAKR